MNNLYNLLTDKVKEQGLTRQILKQKLEFETLDRINCELFQFIKDETSWVFSDVNSFIDNYKIIIEHQQIQVLYAFNEYCYKFFDTYNDFGKSVLNKLSEQLEEEDSDYQPTEEDEQELILALQDDFNYDDFINVTISRSPSVEMMDID